MIENSYKEYEAVVLSRRFEFMPRGIPKGFRLVKRYRPRSHFENLRMLIPNKNTRIIIGRLKKKYRVEGKRTRGKRGPTATYEEFKRTAKKTT